MLDLYPPPTRRVRCQDAADAVLAVLPPAPRFTDQERAVLQRIRTRQYALTNDDCIALTAMLEGTA